MPLEINFAQPSTISAHESINLVSDFASVISIAPFFRQQRVCVRKVRVAEYFTTSWCMTARREGIQECAWHGICASTAHTQVPIISDQFAHRKTIARIADGWRQHLLHWQFAEALVQLEPPV